MGLDVYLKKFQDYDHYLAVTSNYNTAAEDNWHSIDKHYENMSEQERTDVRAKNKELALSLGLTPNGIGDELVDTIELPSTKHPDHFFKIGYFRSSYNENGLNRILQDRIDTSLEEIFCPLDQYTFHPSWDVALVKARLVLDRLKKAIKEEGPWQVSSQEVMSSPTLPQSAREALAKFLETVAEYKSRRQSNFTHYTDSIGRFIPGGEALKVRAIMAGEQLGELVVYVVYENDSGLQSYVDAMDIVVETCEWALANEPEKCYLCWSA